MRALLFLLIFTAGCEITPCDPHQTKVGNSSCVPDAPAGGGGSSSTGGTSNEAGDANGGGGGATECSTASRFGDACHTDSECLCDTNYCALSPGEDVGICTHTGCIEDPSVCPFGFECSDLSVSDPSLPSICVPAD